MRRKPDDRDGEERDQWRQVTRETAMVELERSSAPVLFDARVDVGQALSAEKEMRRSA